MASGFSTPYGISEKMFQIETLLPSPLRKQGPRAAEPSLALDPRFRGDDENGDSGEALGANREPGSP